MTTRRDFITALGGAAAWPLAARAQQPAMPVVGWLNARSPDDTVHLVAAFHRGLGEQGFVEGQNVAIESRWALGQFDRLPALAAELVGRRVAVLASTGGELAALAAKAATSTIPIVFAVGGDPVRQELATSYNRPGGNATGITLLTNTLEPKRLGLLRDLVPRTASFGVLLNPRNAAQAQRQLGEVEKAARTIGLRVHALRASTDDELDAAFKSITDLRITALAVVADPFFDTRRERIVALAARHAVPAMYHFREFADAGGLASYGVDASDVHRQLGVYVGRVLNGAKPAELPVLQATKFQFVINLKTARGLGLDISADLLTLADEVIE
jgi:ABC-type uncharacterized transport system substrate-binding protein